MIWTEKEIDYLSDKWGNVSLDYLCKKLKRSPKALATKAYKLGLNSYSQSSDLMTLTTLIKTIYGYDNGDKRAQWTKLGCPYIKKKIQKSTMLMINIDDFWEWAEKNKSEIDFSRLEENMLGAEPDWLKKKRSQDFMDSKRRKVWTDSDVASLKSMINAYRYTYDEIAQRLGHSVEAIWQKLYSIGFTGRPIRPDQQTKWTPDDMKKIVELINEGYTLSAVAVKTGKTQASICKHLNWTFGTRSFKKIRRITHDQEAGKSRA